jgi:hypothetical protein
VVRSSAASDVYKRQHLQHMESQSLTVVHQLAQQM